MTVELRSINAVTINESLSMPYMDYEVIEFSGSTCFAQLVFVSRYWQLPVHPKSYAICGLFTPNGAVSSIRVLQELSNSVSYFQRSVEPLFSELRDSMKAWLDEFNLYANNEEKLLDTLEAFLRICNEKVLFISAKKCRLFIAELKWCGRIFSENGYKWIRLDSQD